MKRIRGVSCQHTQSVSLCSLLMRQKDILSPTAHMVPGKGPFCSLFLFPRSLLLVHHADPHEHSPIPLVSKSLSSTSKAPSSEFEFDGKTGCISSVLASKSVLICSFLGFVRTFTAVHQKAVLRCDSIHSGKDGQSLQIPPHHTIFSEYLLTPFPTSQSETKPP